MFAIFFAGAAGAKAAVPPVVIAGLALFLLTRRRVDRVSAAALLLSITIFIGFLATMYRGGNAGMRLDLSAGALGHASQLVVHAFPWLPHPLPVAAGIGVGFLGLFGAPLSGLVWFAGRRSE